MNLQSAPIELLPANTRLGGFAAVLLISLLSGASHGQTNYVSTEIARDLENPRFALEDLNGDGRLDLIMPSWERNLGRELLIHYQLEDGRFSPTAKAIEIKTEIIAVGFADLRPDPGKELVLFANNGVFSLSTAIDGYAGNLKPLLQWKLIADVPDADSIELIMNIRDLDGDGFPDLLLPGEKTYGFFRGGENETFTLATEFSTINQDLPPLERPSGNDGLSASIDINATDGIKLSVSAARPTPFAEFIEDWTQSDPDAKDLLQAENWIPSAILSDFDGDGRDDIVFLNVGLDIRGQVNLLFQDAGGNFSTKPQWQGSIDTRGEISLENLNGDGLMDIVKLTGEGNERDAYFYLNKAGVFDFEHPTQIMRFSGYDVNLNFVDLNNDGKPELNVSYYTIPVVDAIRNAGIVRTQLLYNSSDAEAGQIFSRRPQFRLEENFSATNVRGLAEQMSLRNDIDGNGTIDALYITDQGTLAAKTIDKDLRIASNPFWEYVPGKTIIGFSVRDMNGDDLPDLVLRHISSITLLVASK